MTDREHAVAFVAEHFNVVISAMASVEGIIDIGKLVHDLAEEFKRMREEA